MVSAVVASVRSPVASESKADADGDAGDGSAAPSDAVTAAATQAQSAIEEFLTFVAGRSNATAQGKTDLCRPTCTRCYGIAAVASTRRAQYALAAATAPSAAGASGAAAAAPPLELKDPLAAMEELPSDPAAPPPGWNAVSGQFVAAGAVNTAEDSKFSHPSDGVIDFVSARKGGCVSMVGLAARYVCGDEFKSPLMEHDKAMQVVVVPEQDDTPYNVDGEVVRNTGAVGLLLLPGLVSTYGVL